MKKLLITTGLLLLSSIGYTQDLSGDWSGKLIISEQRSIPFAFHLTFKDGNYQVNTTPVLSPVAVPDELLNDVFEAEIGQLTSPWYRYFYSYNPADEFEKISCPILSINGSKDIQVEPKIHQGGIRSALRKAKNRDVTIIELEGLNHLFQKCKTCTIDEYKDLEETFSPEALNVISNWILKRI